MKKPIPFGNKYLLLERVNVGGMAEVFKAKAFGVEGFERLIAVKRILPSIAEDQEFITMFIDEAKIAVQLTHANIAQIFDLGKVADSYFIAMEFVRGKDLRAIFDRLRKRSATIPVPMACYTVMKVCEGLDYAHNKKDSAGRGLNLVHRDVSPQNVLLSYDGEIKLIDFGIAKAANKAGKTQAGILKGKFGYMSPEQVRGLPLDRRSDVFSVGIVLYELLTGERLFVGESDFSTLEKVRNVEIMPPSTYNRKIPEELEQIVLKALAKDVDDRYQTAMDLHDDLQSFMYTSGNFFARKDLGAYMRKTFAEEIAREEARDEQFRQIRAPGDSGLGQFNGLPTRSGGSAPPRSSRPAPPPPPPSQTSGSNRPVRPSQPGRGSQPGRVSQPGPPPPPSQPSQPSQPRAPKRTMMGMGTAPPLPPPVSGSSHPSSGPAPSRRSVPPPPPRSLPHQSSSSSMSSAGAPALDMDWDDDELATQIYDKPDAELFASPGAASPSAAAPSDAPRATLQGHRPLLSAPTASPAPSSGVPAPLSPVSGGTSRSGAPSPFAPQPSAPEPSDARQTREPTEVTRAPSVRGDSSMRWLLGIGALVVLSLAAGAWYMLRSPEPATVQLTTEPPDPTVLFDEQQVQATSSPFVIANVEPGRHLLEVRKTGYEQWSSQVDLRAGQVLQVPVTLRLSEGTEDPNATDTPTGFAMTSTPAGAKVFVDGRELPERTPVRVADLAPGSHIVRVESEGRRPWQQTIEVEDGKVADLAATLEAATVEVRFTSSPPGAEVVLVRGSERRAVGTTPVSDQVDVSGEGWTVEMSLRGHDTWEEDLAVAEGESAATVEAELERTRVASGGGMARVTMRGGGGGETTTAPSGTGTLRVNTRPWSVVYVDGRMIGNTPQMNIPVSAGSHRLTLVNPDFNIRENVSVNVPAGETVTKVITLEQ